MNVEICRNDVKLNLSSVIYDGTVEVRFERNTRSVLVYLGLFVTFRTLKTNRIKQFHPCLSALLGLFQTFNVALKNSADFTPRDV